MTNVPELFGSLVFNQTVMKEMLPSETFKALKNTMDDGTPLDMEAANQIANAMKDWAISKGATHYSHWFQPLTGITAEKHDSFLTPTEEGKIIMSFSGKELIKGEPDASSFPSGGKRSTFEARGYTVWDPTSYPFVKDHTLCIPTAFCSYNGEALDKKTPLLRSMEALNEQSLRVLKLFCNEAKHVTTTMGSEQEYFLVDEKLYQKRKDLKMCGRTLFGARPVKGQEMDDQYFAAIKPRVIEYMEDLNTELWKLGIYAKTEHNEAAPAQHEMAPIFTTSNLAADQNQLTMEIMKKVARKHGLICLLHEKPFEGVNGSGKHNNWSIATDKGENLFAPGKTPRDNAQFLLFLTAVIKAVDDNQDLLRYSVASAGNDHRLGANEAPPAIMSIYVGDELEAILQAIKDGTAYDGKKGQKLEIGADVLPAIPKDSTDRNRTSPFAFTGNRFEFRSVGSSLSISGPNTILNAILADSLRTFADELEKSKDFDSDLQKLIKREITSHWRILFNGNGYGQEWIEEAEKRGLKNYRTTPKAVEHYLDKKNIELFSKLGIYTQEEMKSHYDIKLEKYCQILNIEVGTMLEMVHKDIMPATFKYMNILADTEFKMQRVFSLCTAGIELMEKLNTLVNDLSNKADDLSKKHEETTAISDMMKRAHSYAKVVIPAMQAVRLIADKIEPLLGEEYKPFPSYEDLLFSVQ
ncbi:glutamine synthetase III [Treponema sp. Marseille-Q3903]|uniref:glutamine synthetase III family protein n=1 Tax=Treponema sp. Marseille-Q3903 TaxID=2766703 RepID=UPI0016527C85|nr:glutamine synthetase III [Treponema sp. Marseille-Q3903]MBC6712925.1 glutamine synthetase III [Treponema sp. Marseille-Q3903]